ncbi:MAG: aminoacyl-tRNA hydrolase [Paenibacillus sp. RIFOXYA1_FULL_44_5]|nr:MAG: aminoacyl-tRNA hydrolase [Paenibacillus sp. RIFOXYA1_FULL_44_5]
MKWFVGLGNPGGQYERTRHNAGFMAVDAFAQKWGIAYKQSKFRALVGEGQVAGQKVYVLKPLTYMNLSGEAIRAFMDFYKLQIEDLIVLYDDMDTEVGKIRLRYKGSAGGHNGIKSTIQHLGTQNFQRIRIGISRPNAGYSIVDYVLSSFAADERQALHQAIEQTTQAMESLTQDSFEKVMAKFNA